MFLKLDAAQILATTERLRDRIRERFPTANLARVADELVVVTKSHTARSLQIQQPSYWPRLVGIVALLLAVTFLVVAVQSVHPEVGDRWKLADVIQAVESSLGAMVFLGAAVVSIWSLDVRGKRRRCLTALHEMRAMAHIVDMHQLTKDPERVLHRGVDTKSSPERTFDREQLARYLDYCSEMLSLIGKVAALYVQGFPDAVALSAVDDIEDLTGSLSRKIWQKIVILENAMVAHPTAAEASSDRSTDADDEGMR
ncbi:MAG: hypothetical protein ABL997_10090 [Planctomycetota bacterium]